LTTRNHSVGTPLTTFVVNVCRRLRQQSFETREPATKWESFESLMPSLVTRSEA
jgi:hypothetical protein